MEIPNHYINKLKSVDFWITAIFLFIQTVLYFNFMWIDWTSFEDSTAQKYISICLCLIFSAYKLKNRHLDSVILFFAFFFTVASDTLTLVINSYFTLGVSLFIPAQILYAVRFRLWSKNPPYKSIISRILIVIACVLTLWASGVLDPLTLVTVIYFSMLLYNAIESIFFAKDLKSILFCIGLWLFVCCDVCVGLYNIGDVLGVKLSMDLEYAVSGLCFVLRPNETSVVNSANPKVIARIM